MNPIKKTYIVYHYLAHYRLPIFQELMNTTEINYTLISDSSSEDGIKTVNPDLANMKIQDGGLRWKFVKNKWVLNHKLLWQSGLLSILRNNNFDTVIFLGNPYYISTWASIFYLKFKRKRIVFWTHGVTNDKKGFKWLIRKFFYSFGDAILLYGNNAKIVMAKNGFKENKLHVIFNSLDYNRQLKYRNQINSYTINQTKKELFDNSELPVIIFVGRLTHHKKLNMIIDAIKLLYDQDIKINTLFIGEGDAKINLKELTDRNGLAEHFNFWGPCYDEYELSRLISAADICVSPGEVGLTAMTSLGYGTPVISHNDFNNQMPEYEAIKPGINGDLFKNNSVQDLSVKIRKWLENNKNVDRNIIRENCYSIIDTVYNPNNQAKIINNIISAL